LDLVEELLRHQQLEGLPPVVTLLLRRVRKRKRKKRVKTIAYGPRNLLPKC
jgi:hypothetical protein